MEIMNIDRRQFTKATAFAAFAALAGIGSAASAQSRRAELRIAHLISEAEPTHAASVRWAEAVRTRTAGALDLKIFPNSQLGSEKDVVEQARLGANVSQWNSSAFLGEFVPDFEVLWAPFAFRNVGEVMKVVNSGIFQDMQKKLLETRRLRVLAFNWYFGARHMMTAKKAIYKPEDMRGLKIRSVPVPVTINMMRQLGASPTPMAFGEVYPALQQGVIDGLEVPLSTMYGSKLYEVGKHISLTAHVVQVQCWTIGEQFYQTLPADVRAVLAEEAIKAGEFCTAAALAGEAEFKKKLEQAGVTFTEPDHAAFSAAGERVIKELSARWTPGLYDRVKSIKSA